MIVANADEGEFGQVSLRPQLSEHRKAIRVNEQGAKLGIANDMNQLVWGQSPIDPDTDRTNLQAGKKMFVYFGMLPGEHSDRVALLDAKSLHGGRDPIGPIGDLRPGAMIGSRLVGYFPWIMLAATGNHVAWKNGVRGVAICGQSIAGRLRTVLRLELCHRLSPKELRSGQ